MNHICQNMLKEKDVSIYSKEGDVTAKNWEDICLSWYLKLGEQEIRIQHCPFCDDDLPMDRENLYIVDRDGKENFIESNGLQKLWDAGELYEVPVKIVDPEEGNSIQAVALAVNNNDMFWWACADYDFFSYDDIQTLYEACFDKEGNHNKWGSLIWACLKRGMRPQHPVEDMMKKEGAWTPELEALPIRGNTG